MKMELIQPFINSADAVLAESLQCETRIGDVSMEEETYRRKGVAAQIEIAGDIEGRIILDTDSQTAMHLAKHLAGGEVQPSDELVRETVCELANMVIGNAITSLNDQGFRFKISPPEVHTAEQGLSGSEETEALVMCFETQKGSVYMNIAMRHNRRRKEERSTVVVA
ncbi:MAG TPA: chemotaxis protein CheX [Terriglobales bacterium]|nr:chemotaxis protein CheX [Terriglobales bacterium]